MMEYSTFKLKDGGIMPTIAIGTGTTFAFQNAFKVTEAIVDAVKKGYRHIDTAQIYQTEEHVGKAIYQLISEGVVQRQDLFITSKMPPKDLSIEETLASVEGSLKRLGLEYLDCMMIHWPSAPVGSNPDDPLLAGQTSDPEKAPEVRMTIWQALQNCVEMGKVKHLGLSNFGVSHIDALVKDPKCHTMPILNQIEFNPYNVYDDIVASCNALGITVQAYAPIGSGLKGQDNFKLVLDDPVLKGISRRIGCTVAQLSLAWAIRRNVPVVTKTENRSRMDENLNCTKIVDRITLDEMDKINGLNQNIVKFWNITKFP